jgi:hypothetical protein
MHAQMLLQARAGRLPAAVGRALVWRRPRLWAARTDPRGGGPAVPNSPRPRLPAPRAPATPFWAPPPAVVRQAAGAAAPAAPRRAARAAAASGEVSQSGKKPKRGRAAKEHPEKEKEAAKAAPGSLSSGSLSSTFWAEELEDDDPGESFLVRAAAEGFLGGGALLGAPVGGWSLWEELRVETPGQPGLDGYSAARRHPRPRPPLTPAAHARRLCPPLAPPSPPRPSPSPPPPQGPYMDSVLKVYCLHTEPNFSLPWQRKRQYPSSSSGFIVSAGERRWILTNAHSVDYHTQVRAAGRGEGRWAQLRRGVVTDARPVDSHTKAGRPARGEGRGAAARGATLRGRAPAGSHHSPRRACALACPNAGGASFATR